MFSQRNRHKERTEYMDIILELMNRQIFEATLAIPFKPEENEVDVLIGGTGEKQKFLFPEICCLHMKSYQSWMFLFQKDTLQEEVTTFAGKTYHVHVSETQPYPTGFFGLLVREDTPYRLIFFTSLGVQTRCQTRRVGEILQAKGIISTDSIQKVLEEQKNLKKRLVGEIIADNANMSQDDIEHTLAVTKKSRKMPPRARVGEILIAAGLITQEQVNAALQEQEGNKNKKIGQLLIEHGFVTEDQLLVALAAKFRLKIVDLASIVPNMKALEALSPDIVHRLEVLPVVDKGDRLVIATSQPTDYSLYEHLQFYTGRRIEMVVATSRQIAEAIDRYYPKAESLVDNLIDDLSLDQEVEEESEEDRFSESDSQIVNLVNKILMDGYGKGASDIHL